MKLSALTLAALAVANPISLDMSEMADPMGIAWAEQFDGYTQMIGVIVSAFGTYFETDTLPVEPVMQNIKFSLALLEANDDFSISMVQSLWVKLRNDAYEAVVDYVVDLKKGRQSRTYCNRLVERSGLVDMLIADEHGIEVDVDGVSIAMGCFNNQIVAKGATSLTGYSLSLLDDTCSAELSEVESTIGAILAPDSCGTVYEQRDDIIAIRNQVSLEKDGQLIISFPFGCNIPTVGFANPLTEHSSDVVDNGRFKIKSMGLKYTYVDTF